MTTGNEANKLLVDLYALVNFPAMKYLEWNTE